MVFRPSLADTRELLDAWMMFDEDEEPDETKELRNAWLCPAGPLWEEIAPRGIALPELYSVLLASAGRGGDAVLECDAQALVKMRELSAAHGYRDMVRAVKHARRVQQIFRSGRSWR